MGYEYRCLYLLFTVASRPKTRKISIDSGLYRTRLEWLLETLHPNERNHALVDPIFLKFGTNILFCNGLFTLNLKKEIKISRKICV